MPRQGVKPGNGAPLKLRAGAKHLYSAAPFALVDGERKPPIALLRDHPVAHVAEPIELAIVSERWEPRDVVNDIHDLIAQAPRLLCRTQLLAWLLVGGAHADKPLIHESEGERRCTAPTVRIPVRDLLSTQEAPALLKGSKDEIGNSEPVFPAQIIEPLKVDTALINRRNHRQAFGDAEGVVLATAGRGDVHDARPLFGANVAPRDHTVCGTIWAEGCGYGWRGIKRGAVAPPHQLAPLLGVKYLRARCTTAECGDATRCADPHLAPIKLHQFI